MTPQRFVLAPQQTKERVDRVVARLVEGVSRAVVQRWIEQGYVKVDGRLCRQRELVQAGSVIDVVPGPIPPSDAIADPSITVAVVFEDEHLLVVDKPPGLVVHPARGHPSGTLINGLLARSGFQPSAVDPEDRQGALRPGMIQRLDKDTSGLLVVAKHAKAREGLKEQLSERRFERSYLALTLGTPKDGEIHTWYGRHPQSRIKFTSLVSRGKSAVTRIITREAFWSRLVALVECRLATGRTHQIRVHLAEQAKTPVIADLTYGIRSRDPDILAVTAAIGRQALHAASLGFVHPITQQTMRFHSSPPPDFQEALAILRQQRPSGVRGSASRP